MPARCGLTFFRSSGLSFFISSWRASSSFFFSSAEGVARILDMKVYVCATSSPTVRADLVGGASLRWGWRTLQGGISLCCPPTQYHFIMSERSLPS